MIWADWNMDDTKGTGMSGASFIASSSAVRAFAKSSGTVVLMPVEVLFFVGCLLTLLERPDVVISARDRLITTSQNREEQ